MAINLTIKDKESIIKNIIHHDNFLGEKKGEEGGIISFLEMIWDLRDMPSEDTRFSNARDDIWKHIVMNDDWDYDYLFLDRLKLARLDDQYLLKFINTSVNPEILAASDVISEFVPFINSLIERFELKLVISDYFEELPVYLVQEKKYVSDLPLDIPKNNIPFYVSDVVRKSFQYPCFILNYIAWNDYFTMFTQYGLYFYKDINTRTSIGTLKIMKSEVRDTREVLPESFTELSSDFCSLGQHEEYYDTLKDIFGTQYHSILIALRDTAMYPKIHEKFANESVFRSSLIRDNQAENILRTIRFRMNGLNMDNCFKFSYSYIPPYTTDKENYINVNFDFVYNSKFNHRIYAIIGKNGAGKTHLLSNIASDLSKNDPQNIIPAKPLFSKIFTISYSYFDNFPLPESNVSFNYIYCGLKNKKGERLQEKELRLLFLQALRKIVSDKRTIDWLHIIREFLPADIYEALVINDEDEIQINIKVVKNVFDYLSSGENIFLYVITNIVSEIRNNSLILYDEPETHLHPNAISLLINSLYELVDKYDSFCIIGTHSPIIIQEISSRDVLILEKQNNIAEIRKLEHESFGENLTTITNDIFGNRDIAKYHMNKLKSLVEQGLSYAEIVELLENQNLPLSLNTSLYLKGFIKEIDNEER